MTETEAAYLAGIIDGEGSISMTRVSGKKNNKLGTPPYWRITIAVSSCDEPLIDWLAQWGGATLRNIDRGPNRRVQHRWTIVANVAREVLPRILPYMIIKKHRAVWAIEALAIQKGRGGRSYTEDELVRLSELRLLFDTDRSRSLAARNRAWEGE